MTRASTASAHRGGFTLIEVLIAMAVLTLALVAIAAMFPAGYRQVTDAGRMTLAVTAGRQILEDIGSLPFASIVNLDNYDSLNPVLPAADPERAVAIRWTNDYTAAEGQVQVQVVDCELAANPCALPGGPNPNLRLVTVNISVTALPQGVQLTTFIANVGI